MKYLCVEHDVCGFADQVADTEKYKDLVCPNCYSPLLVYRDNEKPIWQEESKDFTERSYER